jgi:hypothetical protein
MAATKSTGLKDSFRHNILPGCILFEVATTICSCEKNARFAMAYARHGADVLMIS